MIAQLDEEVLESGIYHYCGDQLCSWHEFGRVIFAEAKKFGLPTPDLIHSILTSDYPTVAKRPGYSVLNCHKIRTKFGVNNSDWKLGVKYVVSKLSARQK